MFKFKQQVISASHRNKRAVRISLMLAQMCSNYGYHNNHRKHSKYDDDDDDNDNTANNNNYSIKSNKKLKIFKLRQKYA